MLRVAGTINDSIVDGPGLRFVIFLQGCLHNCDGCHNPDTHPIDGGEEKSVESIIQMIRKNTLLDGITLSGGEPFLQSRQLETLLCEYRKYTFKPHVWLYTGFTWEQILANEDYKNLLQYIDVIVDGRFIKSLKTNERWKGSSNQRIIDVNKSLKNKDIILWN